MPENFGTVIKKILENLLFDSSGFKAHVLKEWLPDYDIYYQYVDLEKLQWAIFVCYGRFNRKEEYNIRDMYWAQFTSVCGFPVTYSDSKKIKRSNKIKGSLYRRETPMSKSRSSRKAKKPDRNDPFPRYGSSVEDFLTGLI